MKLSKNEKCLEKTKSFQKSIFKSRKAQIAGQMFIFILAAGLAIMIIAYGYKAISSFTSRTEDIALVNFKTDLQNEIRAIASDYGSVKRLDLQLPGKFDILCLLDLSYSESSKAGSCLCNPCQANPDDFNPEVCDAWTTAGNQDNAFLVPITPLKVTKMEIDTGYACIKPRGSKISLRLEGRGDSTKVSEWPAQQ